MPEKTLSGMIASGELDCVIIARPPNSFREKHPDVVRLFPDYEAIEQKYYEQTRVYPIMHVIALRKSILEGKPGSRAISITHSRNPNAAASSAFSIPPCRAIRCRG